MGLETLKARRGMKPPELTLEINATREINSTLEIKGSSRGQIEGHPDALQVVAPMDRRIKYSRIRRPTMLLIAALLVAACVGAYGVVEYGFHRRISIDAPRLTISPVRQAVFSEIIPVTGTVQPEKTVLLDVNEGGQVTEKLVEEGSFVQIGQPLVRLRNVSLELQVTGQEAQLGEQLFQLTSVQLNLRETRLQRDRDLNDIDYQIRDLTNKLARRHALLAQGFEKRADVEDMEADLDRYHRQRDTVGKAHQIDVETEAAQTAQLTSAIRLLQQNLAVARRSLEDLTIKAPIAGQLTALDADAGAFKATGQRIGQIDRTDTYKITGLIDEFYLGRVAADQNATADIDGASYTLRVSRIHPEVKDRQFAVDFVFVGPAPSQIRRGQTVQLRLQIGSAKPALVTANGAFFDDNGGGWAFVVAPSGEEAVKRIVAFGRRNPDAVEILSGLAAGERIITSSYADFKQIDKIDIRNGTASATANAVDPPGDAVKDDAAKEKAASP